MDKARPFDSYFDAVSGLDEVKLHWLRHTRELVHQIYPDVVERVSYAMPGFYPKEAKKATQQLFLVMANARWLGLYGTPGLEPVVAPFTKYGVTTTKGSIHVPYDMPEQPFQELLTAIIHFNLARHGFS
jgi:uncharacterized protein YdhG (YjbR/CyaY superfamily)